MSIELVAGSWGVLMALAPMLQIRRMLRERSSQDVSLGYLLVLEVGFLLYLAYGLSISNRVLIVTNIVAIVMNSITIVVALALGRRNAPRRLAPLRD